MENGMSLEAKEQLIGGSVFNDHLVKGVEEVVNFVLCEYNFVNHFTVQGCFHQNRRGEFCRWKKRGY
jgi:hypothetical protein